MGTDERVTIGMVSIAPSTGDLVYDEFLGMYYPSDVVFILLNIVE
jgi:hypothetical protein